MHTLAAGDVFGEIGLIATGTRTATVVATRADQAIELGAGALSIDSQLWADATHAWRHLNSHTERGIDIDVHGVHFGAPS